MAKKFLWVDLEMSGLDVSQCRILEVAAIITDHNLQPLEQYEAIVYQDESVLDAMDAWCKQNHGKTGLTAAVKTGKPELQVEADLIALLDRHYTKDERPVLCGNSIGQDRKFIDAYWKKLAERLHYRMVDVTSFKEIFREQLGIEHKKKGAHRAVDDIKESIAELGFYLSFVKPDAKK
jgi:oligoribonuclease